jgi:hypothetical protein
MIKYRFRVPSAAVFTLYSYSKPLEYRFRVSTAASLMSAYALRKLISRHDRMSNIYMATWLY